jgi:hypothetical protein
MLEVQKLVDTVWVLEKRAEDEVTYSATWAWAAATERDTSAEIRIKRRIGYLGEWIFVGREEHFFP